MNMQTNRFSNQLTKWGKRSSTTGWQDWIAPEWWVVGCALLMMLVFWSGGLFEARVARADTLPLCAAGQDYDAGLCYPKCNDGYEGIGPVCWQKCPSGYKDDGALCRKDVTITPKDSYTRGAGTPPGCGSGEEPDGALCYPKCNDGYSGVGPVCWQNCPADYHNDGLTCRRDLYTFAKDSYDRGAGTVLPCNSSEERSGLLCYPKCNDGYSGVGPVCWQQCPDGFTNDGAFCRRPEDIFFKSSYGRGAGIPLHACGDGQEADGGLCYPTCKDGYGGAGPVCWQHCPEGFTDDGAFCRKDAIITAKASYGRGAGTVPNCDINDLNCAGNFEVSNNFRPFPDGYHFENWGASSNKFDESTDFDNATLIRMFGADIVCQTGSTPENCVLKATARDWRAAQLVAVSKGHCYGMAVSSQMFFAHLNNQGTYQSGAGTTYGLDPITAVRRHISELWSTQALQPADGSSAGWVGYSMKPSEVLNLVRTQLQSKPNDPYVLGIYKTDNMGKKLSGHAVTPFAIENRGGGIYWLHVYDNNKPKEDRYIIFDTNQETWLYGKAAANPAERSNAWQGDANTDSLRLRPTSAHRMDGWKCPFCLTNVNASSVQAADSLEFTLVGSTGLLVANAQNQATGWDFNQHKYVRDLSGGELIETMSGIDSAASALIHLPFTDDTTPYTVYASGDGLTQTVPIRLLMAGPGYTVAVNDLTLAPAQHLRMSFRPDGRQIAFSASDTASFSPTLALATDLDLTGNGYRFDVGGLQLTPGKTVTVTLDLDQGALRFEDNDENADTYALGLLRITPQGQEQIYKTDAVALESTTDGTMNFAGWDGNGAINFVVNGKTQVMENKAVKQNVFLPVVIK